MHYLPDRIAALVLKHLQDTLTEAEAIELGDWLADSDENRQIFNRYSNEDELLQILAEVDRSKASGWQKVQQGVSLQKVVPMQRNRRWWRYAAAAVVMIMIASGVYLWRNQPEKATVAGVETPGKRFKNDVAPGTDHAVLTLSGGQKIILDSNATGNLVKQAGTDVVNNNGQLQYATGQTPITLQHATIYNTLTTARGNQYRVTLSDGTIAWLNAASSITYPVIFGSNERKVSITGEVYFEVAHDAARPFKVNVMAKAGGNREQVEVLGTHFNINAYDDEVVVKTTLLEGKVKVSAGNNDQQFVYLQPGQQAVLNETGNFKLLSNVNTDAVVAWKDGYFKLQYADIESIMREVQRWYDVDVVYKDSVKSTFSGTISRNVNVSKLLKLMELTGSVHFKIDGRKITVAK